MMKQRIPADWEERLLVHLQKQKKPVRPLTQEQLNALETKPGDLPTF